MTTSSDGNEEGLTPHPDRPQTWPRFYPLLLAHDVGHVRDRSTAVIGGGSPFQSSVLGILDLRELPQGLYGSARASALAAVDCEYHNSCLIVADLSNDESYGEFLYETFGRRVIGVHISRHGDGMQFERRLVGRASMLVYTIGRTYLFEHFHSLATNDLVRMVPGPVGARAFAQLQGLQVEAREGGTIYKTLPGQHDDLAISMCMLGWALRHPHLRSWLTAAFADRAPRPQQPKFTAAAWT